MYRGIDVSSHQHKIDWEKVKESGVDFAMLRIGYGSNRVDQTDAYVYENAYECNRLGIPYGLYIYSYALTEDNVHSEVEHMIRVAKDLNGTLGYYFDMEDADGYKAKHGLNPALNGERLTNFCRIFMYDMINAGYTNVGVYANYHYFKHILDVNSLRKYGKIWLAHWGIAEPSIPCDIWQYTSDGAVKGINGRVDMNYYYGNLCKTTEDIAKEVIEGLWGNGSDRIERLTRAGFDYAEVQKCVNVILGMDTKCVEEVALEVIAGKWGNGVTRKRKLKEAGYDYSAVQNKVNEMLK